MLLRRVRERVSAGDPCGRFQCIATSATVGGTGPAAVTGFASKPVRPALRVGHDDDPSRQDLVGAQRAEIPAGPFWGPLAAADYLRLAGEDGDPAGELPAAGRGISGPVQTRPPRCPARQPWPSSGACWPGRRCRSPAWPVRSSPPSRDRSPRPPWPPW